MASQAFGTKYNVSVSHFLELKTILYKRVSFALQVLFQTVSYVL
jgi:hypothetical protein